MGKPGRGPHFPRGPPDQAVGPNQHNDRQGRVVADLAGDHVQRQAVLDARHRVVTVDLHAGVGRVVRQQGPVPAVVDVV